MSENETTPFENLAGGRSGCCRCARELDLAGVPWIDGPIYGETKQSVIGVLHGWVFTRSWYYWSVRSSGKALSYTRADLLNKSMGTEVRAYGYAGGTSLEAELPLSYHVDTQEGLMALVAFIRENGREVKC